MHKTLVNVICAFVPKRKCRHRLRNKLLSRFQKIGLVNPNFIVNGQNNKLILIDEQGNEKPMTTNIPGMKINVQGDNNIIRIPEKNQIRGCFNIRSNNALIDIKSQKTLSINVNTLFQDGQKLIINEDTIIFGANIFLNEKEASVLIGKNCLFSSNITIWATDGHAILDAQTNKILNPITKPIIIHDHCWCGHSVFMTKNTGLAKNSVIGGGSVITKTFTQENVLVAGNPAKIIKENINWKHETAAQLLTKGE